MFIMMGVITALLLSLVILFIAISAYRRQQMLNQKRSEYLSVKRDNSNQWKRFEISQVEIDRLRAYMKTRTREIDVMLLDMDHKRKEVREVLEILKDENERVNNHMDQELSKIVERRKQILRTRWKEMNGLKTLFVQKMQEMGQLREGIEDILSRKDTEYQKWNQTKLRMERLKHEFEIISRSSILTFILSFARKED